jgi:hypothetical protein
MLTQVHVDEQNDPIFVRNQRYLHHQTSKHSDLPYTASTCLIAPASGGHKVYDPLDSPVPCRA